MPQLGVLLAIDLILYVNNAIYNWILPETYQLTLCWSCMIERPLVASGQGFHSITTPKWSTGRVRLLELLNMISDSFRKMFAMVFLFLTSFILLSHLNFTMKDCLNQQGHYCVTKTVDYPSTNYYLYVHGSYTTYRNFDFFRPRDAIWRNSTWPTLVQVKTCGLTQPSHCMKWNSVYTRLARNLTLDI